MTSRGALGLLLLLALAACNNNGGGSAVTLPPSGPASYKIGEAQNYTVIAGDTIDGVAQQFNMPVEALIAANHLVYPYALHAGQTLFIPGRGAPGAGTGYVVVAGDTLTRIARHNGTTVAALAALNGLVPPYVIKVGQRLTLPGGSPMQTAAVAGATPAASASGGEMIQFPPAEPAPPVPAAGSVKVATEALSTPTGASATPSTPASEQTASQSAAAPPPVLQQPAKPTSKSTTPASSTEPAASTTANG
ncbi:MAG: LysM peptidoglycan-binding domain-containing protein, partial [Dongiales bacterium]